MLIVFTKTGETLFNVRIKFLLEHFYTNSVFLSGRSPTSNIQAKSLKHKKRHVHSSGTCSSVRKWKHDRDPRLQVLFYLTLVRGKNPMTKSYSIAGIVRQFDSLRVGSFASELSDATTGAVCFSAGEGRNPRQSRWNLIPFNLLYVNFCHHN